MQDQLVLFGSHFIGISRTRSHVHTPSTVPYHAIYAIQYILKHDMETMVQEINHLHRQCQVCYRVCRHALQGTFGRLLLDTLYCTMPQFTKHQHGMFMHLERCQKMPVEPAAEFGAHMAVRLFKCVGAMMVHWKNTSETTVPFGSIRLKNMDMDGYGKSTENQCHCHPISSNFSGCWTGTALVGIPDDPAACAKG